MFSGCSRKVPCTSHLPLSTTTSVNFSNCHLPQPLPVLRCSSSSLPTNPRPPRHQKRLSAAVARGLRRPDEVNLMALKKRFWFTSGIKDDGTWFLAFCLSRSTTKNQVPDSLPSKNFHFSPYIYPPMICLCCPKKPVYHILFRSFGFFGTLRIKIKSHRNSLYNIIKRRD